ncbi:MAG: multidrug ABC transporter ATP-binding protein [Candidatus Lambdaproteobacteria bacterium RIFOXYD1_FULL_56_27]|uniref:Multidrug ABC transporter ATP-binding protein n=1 Tax=Candidatus Lambdaproteobacteria bacterium RIFOXYD2_FULL_56_26 TaxID=1817773 RepID=A0A1F6H397_9PROT|nr:MAG: multidrug ABC transporter ATP-binding protein [Candidatus Lambdaproteobacteria bacterium RIFOXYC1_FULL_56_13]OGH04867.1 MAG: multidrug ABC transporter ATP-binding protein [Candidatus Lambdaproteobacteria bacterium RIFOXYD2_FULL_56_26]OGH09332.1 MAG: multidrug ABC transporter ATP-binding protein [Candidatus Lambdaproteobacteria bacterium RIFOXYD1_FULL_56_27]
MIQASLLNKSFRIHKKQPGFIGALGNFFNREYHSKPAVVDFEVTVRPGEVIGLLGPNGAGKTTLMKMFTGIIVPSAGELKVLGQTPHLRSREFRKQIALVMGQKSQLWWDLPALDSFLLLQKYYEIPKADFKRRLDELSTLLGVIDLLEVHVRKLSLGERMKLELMSCLLHEPKILFLDEPTIGLDLVAQRNIRAFLARYQKEKGTTLILTSHYMADVEALCQRLVLILGGKKRFDGKIEDFEQILGNNKIVAYDFDRPLSTEDPVLAPFAPVWNEDRTRVELTIPALQLRELSQKILKDYPVVDFHTEKLPIERVMTQLMDRPELL